MKYYYPIDYHEERNTEAHIKRYTNQLKYLPSLKNKRILDIGCARGDFLSFLYNKEPSIIAHGVDYFSEKINHNNITFHKSLLTDCLFESNFFDIITSFGVFEHLHEASLYFKEVSRILKTNGDFIILVTNSESLYGRKAHVEDIPRHTYHFSEHTLKQYAEMYNLELTKVEYDNSIFDGSGKGTFRWLFSSFVGITFENIYFKKINKLQKLIMNSGIFLDNLIFKKDWERKKRCSGIIVASFKKL
jgi:cyclopropane fatty-acyl-phospholipid synthase-like methyltransferase